MSCKHTRVWIQDIYKKSTLLTKKVVGEHTQYKHCYQSIQVHDFGDEYLCISNYHGSFIDHLQNKSYFFHIEKDIIKFRY